MLAIARQRLELGRIALLPLLAPPLLCSLAVALGIAFLPASAHQYWWLEVAIGAALLGGCLLLFERRIAKAAWTAGERERARPDGRRPAIVRPKPIAEHPMAGKIYVGIGGWTFEPWRGVFYPDDLTQKRELEYASRKLSSIEINGTYYSSFKPASWAKWRDETPDGFVFAVKASRFCTNRRVLAEAGESVQRFFAQGIVELGTGWGR